MFYSPLNGSGAQYPIPLVFLPTGELDLSLTNASDLQLANNILSPTVALLNKFQPTLDIWKLLNWIFVSFYWTILADFGQVAPTTFYYLSDVSETGSVSIVNLTAPTVYPPTNNIFVNESLFEIYESYLRNELLLALAPSLFVPPFAPLNSTNRLEPKDVEFVQNYSCWKRAWKSFWLDAVVSVLVAQYSLFFGTFSFFLLVAAWFHRRQPNGLFTVAWNGTD